MSKRTRERLARLLPEGRPRYVRIYDNGGETADRYAVVYNGKYRTLGRKAHTREPLPPVQYVNMSGAPYHPQGVCQHGEAHTFFDAPEGWTTPVGRKHPQLGLRIEYDALPADCQRVVLDDYIDIWALTYVAGVRFECEKCRAGFWRVISLGHDTLTDKHPLCGPCEQGQPPAEYYDCPGCDQYHPKGFDGDCRDDASRFTGLALDLKHGDMGWVVVPEHEGQPA